jgi:hypothetical protein
MSRFRFYRMPRDGPASGSMLLEKPFSGSGHVCVYANIERPVYRNRLPKLAILQARRRANNGDPAHFLGM